MITATATATEMQNNFGRYLNLVMSGQENHRDKEWNGRSVGLFERCHCVLSDRFPYWNFEGRL